MELVEGSSSDFLNFAKLHREESGNEPRANPILHPDFLRCALEHFADKSVQFLMAGENGSFIGGLPLVNQNWYSMSSFCPPQMPLAPLLWSRSHSGIDIFLSKILKHKKFMPLCTLFNYDAKYLPRIGESDSVRMSDYATTICIENQESFEAYWDSRSKKLRSNIRRYRKRAKKLGYTISFKVYREFDELRQGLSTYAKIESAGWKGRAGTAIREGDRQWSFYLDVLHAFGKRREALILELRADDVPISSRFGILDRDCAVFLKTTFDEDFGKIAPGRIQLAMSLQELLDNQGGLTIEFYTKADQDMRQWGVAERKIEHVTTYRNSIFARAADIKSDMVSRISE